MCNCHLLEGYSELVYGVPDRLRCRNGGRCPSVHTAGTLNDSVSRIYSACPSGGPVFSDVVLSEPERVPAHERKNVQEDETEPVFIWELVPAIDSPLYAKPFAHPVFMREMLGRIGMVCSPDNVRMARSPREADRLYYYGQFTLTVARHREVLEDVTNRHVASLEGLEPQEDTEDALEYALRVYEVRLAAYNTFIGLRDLLYMLRRDPYVFGKFEEGQLRWYQDHVLEGFRHIRSLDQYLSENLEVDHPYYHQMTWVRWDPSLKRRRPTIRSALSVPEA